MSGKLTETLAAYSADGKPNLRLPANLKSYLNGPVYAILDVTTLEGICFAEILNAFVGDKSKLKVVLISPTVTQN